LVVLLTLGGGGISLAARHHTEGRDGNRSQPGEVDDPDLEAAAPAATGPPPQVSQFVGMHLTPVAINQESPSGVLHVNQTLLAGPTGESATNVVERVRQDGWDMIWFERNDPDDQSLTILDAALIPPRAPGEDFLEPGSCQYAGVPDDSVAALAHPTGDEFTTVVRQAWRFDPHTQTIQPIPTTGWSCRKQAND
jgi:hypothetical protein